MTKKTTKVKSKPKTKALNKALVSKSLFLFGVKCKDKKNAKEFIRMMATGGW